MLESTVSRKLREAVVSLGGVCWKLSDRFHASRPDLLIAYSGRTSFVEVKVHPNKPSKLQQLTLNELYNALVPTYVLTYYPLSKSMVLINVSGIAEAPFYSYKECAFWLLEQSCFNIKKLNPS